MGGITQPLTQAAEETVGTELKQAAQNWMTSSGEAFIKSVDSTGFIGKWISEFEHVRDSNKSRSMNTVTKIFKQVPEQHHGELEKAVLLKPNQLPQQYTQQAKDLYQVSNKMVSQAQQAGINSVASPVRQPVVLSPDGPSVNATELRVKNSKLRNQAIGELVTKQGMRPAEAREAVDDVVRSQQSRRAASSHIAYPKVRIETGQLPIQQRWERWAEATGEHIANNTFFGSNNEHIAGVIDSVKQSKGDVSAENLGAFFDALFKSPVTQSYRKAPVYDELGIATGISNKFQIKPFSAYKEINTWEMYTRKLQGHILTPFIGAQHAIQYINMMQKFGVGETLAGVRNRLTDWNAYQDYVANSGAATDNLHKAYVRSLQGQGKTLFDDLFHQPGFSWIRARQTETAAIIGDSIAKEAVENLLKDKQGSAELLQTLHIDPTEVKATGKYTDSMRSRAMYEAAKQTMFFDSPLQKRFRRDMTPWARTTFMYTNFHFNQVKLIKNSLIEAGQREGWWGVTKSLIKLGTIFPAAGGLLLVLENGLHVRALDKTSFNTGNKETDLYLDAAAHSVGFGLVYHLNAKNTRDTLQDLITGPLPNMALRTAEHTITGVEGKKGKHGAVDHDYKPLERDLLNRIPVLGAPLQGLLIPYEDKKKGQ